MQPWPVLRSAAISRESRDVESAHSTDSQDATKRHVQLDEAGSLGIQFSDKGWYVVGVVAGSQAARCEALHGIGSRCTSPSRSSFVVAFSCRAPYRTLFPPARAFRASRLIPHTCARRLFLTHVQNQPIAPGGLLMDDDAIRSMLRTAGRPARLSFSETPPAQQVDEAASEENPLIR